MRIEKKIRYSVNYDRDSPTYNKRNNRTSPSRAAKRSLRFADGIGQNGKETIPTDQYRPYKIIANYHSHPSSPARPSDEDIRLAYDRHIVYIIVSLALPKPDIKAFSIEDGMVTCMEIKVT